MLLFFIAYWLWHKESETVKVVPENQQIVTQIDSLPASDTIHDKDINQETLGAKADIPSDTKGIESTANLRDMYYSRYYTIKSGEPQSRRNFNRYFKKTRENLEKSNFRLLICRSSTNRIGFYTVENPNYKPED